MEIKEYLAHNNLIDFYFSRGLEFDDINKKYEYEPLFSYVVTEEDTIIGASTCYKENENYVLDYIAIENGYEKMGIGTELLNATIDHIKKLNGKNIYILAKEPGFFLKNGFKTIQKTEKLDFHVCFKCSNYKVTCFPEIMIYEI